MIYVILGPTASGKSDAAIELQKFLNCPIINFDAFQVYKEINKGTAKPSKEEILKYNMKLYDFCSINDDYNVFLYQQDARKLLDEFKNKDVIMVGGTGLYLKATLFDYKFLKEEKMNENYLDDLSNDELYEKLLKIDEDDARKIGNNNRKRLIRALYIHETHSVNKTKLNNNGKDNLLYKNVIFLGINLDRNILYERINIRVDVMFKNGLKDEINELRKKYNENLRAFQAIGYKEFFTSLNDEDIKELIKKNTRNYAKRQMTFFKHQFKDVKWFENIKDLINYVQSRN